MIHIHHYLKGRYLTAYLNYMLQPGNCAHNVIVNQEKQKNLIGKV